jgi:chlorosome envelope protein F
MANENNGVFSDLFNAVGTLAQNIADTLVNGVSSATTLVQTCTNLCATIVTSTANTAIQIIQSVTTGISSAITPKK